MSNASIHMSSLTGKVTYLKYLGIGSGEQETTLKDIRLPNLKTLCQCNSESVSPVMAIKWH